MINAELLTSLSANLSLRSSSSLNIQHSSQRPLVTSGSTYILHALGTSPVPSTPHLQALGALEQARRSILLYSNSRYSHCDACYTPSLVRPCRCWLWSSIRRQGASRVWGPHPLTSSTKPDVYHVGSARTRVISLPAALSSSFHLRRRSAALTCDRYSNPLFQSC